MPDARVRLALSLILPVAAAVVLLRYMPAMWVSSPTITMARFTAASVDRVSCAPGGLHPDGKADGVVEIHFTVRRSALFFLLPRGAKKQTYVRLERHNPWGANETGPNTNVLGIAEEPGGKLLNRPGGLLGIRKPGAHHLFAHFCRDGHDIVHSGYRVIVDGAVALVGGSLSASPLVAPGVAGSAYR